MTLIVPSFIEARIRVSVASTAEVLHLDFDS